MNTSRRLPGGAPIWNEGKRRLMATPAVVGAAFLRKSLRFGMSSPSGSDVQECAWLANTQGWDEVNQFDSHCKWAYVSPKVPHLSAEAFPEQPAANMLLSEAVPEILKFASDW